MWIEKLLKKLMLIIGIVGVIVIYGGFFYLQFNAEHPNQLPWYILLSPWICIYFGLNPQQQLEVLQWFKKKFGK